MANWDERAERWSRMQAQRGEVYGPATEMMLDLANLRNGNRALDVATGTGDQTLLAAGRVGPTGYVLAIDLSTNMLNAATDAESGKADLETLDRMYVAWKEWGEHPDSFIAQFKCEAVGWKE